MLTETPLFYQLPSGGTPPSTAATATFSIPVYNAAPSGESDWHVLPAYSPLPVGTYLSRPDATGVRYLTPKKGLPTAQLPALHTQLLQALAQAPAAMQLPAAAAGTPQLTQCNALGYGFDLGGELSDNGFLEPLVTFSWTSDFTMPDKSIVLIPSGVIGMVDTTSSGDATAYESREAWQQSLTTSVGIKGHYGAFSAEFDASFSTTKMGSQQQSYTSIQQTANIANFRLPATATPTLNANFLSAYQALPTEVEESNFQQFADFFRTYGIIYVQSIELGASANISITTQKSSSLSTESIDASAKVQASAIFAGVEMDASVSASESWQAYSSGSTTKTFLKGGDTGLQLKFEQDLATPFDPPATTTDDYRAWASSVDQAPAIVRYSFGNVWELLPNQAPNLAEAWNTYGSKLFPILRLSLSANGVQNGENSYEYAANAPVPMLSLAGDALTPFVATEFLAGVQVVVVRDYTAQPASASIILNSYYGTNTFDDKSWWDGCAAAITAVIQPNDILILATYNNSAGLAPSISAISQVLENAGAEDMLYAWMNTGNEAASNYMVETESSCYFCVGLYGNPSNPCVEYFTAGFNVGVTAAVEFFFDPSTSTVGMDLMSLNRTGI